MVEHMQKAGTMGKTYRVKEIREMLLTRNDALRRGILAIHNRRGNAEFEADDAGFLSSLAEQIMRGSLLTDKQLAAARKLMPKYAGQLTRIANSEV